MRIRRSAAIGIVAALAGGSALATGTAAQAASSCAGTRVASVAIQQYPTGTRMGVLEVYRASAGGSSVTVCAKVTRQGSFVGNGYRTQITWDGTTILARTTANPAAAGRTITYCSTCGQPTHTIIGYVWNAADTGRGSGYGKITQR